MLGIVANPFHAKVDVNLSAADIAAAAASKKKLDFPQSTYTPIKMQDLIIPVIINGEVKRRVFTTVRIMATTKEKDKEMKEGLTRYQSVVFNDLVAYFQDFFLDHDMINMMAIKTKLTAHAKAVYGDDVVKDALLINVFEQPNDSTR